MWGVLGGILSAIASPVTEGIKSVAKYIDGRQQIKAAQKERRDQLEYMRLENQLTLIQNGQMSDIQSDNYYTSGGAGYMDDAIFFIGFTPIVMCFIPPCVPWVHAGFEVLATLPEWYLYGLALMFFAIFGYKRIFAPIIEKIAYAKFGIKKEGM